MHFRPLPLLTAFSVISLVILFSLGNWQYGRYQEKLDRQDVPAVPFETVTANPVELEGKSAQLVYGIVGGRTVWRRYVPAVLDGQDQTGLLLYDTVSTIEPQQLSLGNLTPVTLEAAIFVADLPSSILAAADDPERNVWNRRDTVAMMNNLGFDVSEPVFVVEPQTITIEDPQLGTRELQNPYAAPKPIDPLPPARHFGYALTWWGLAFALIGVYIAFHVSRGRLGFRE